MTTDRAEFEAWLVHERGLSRSTSKLYGRIASRIGDTPPMNWLVETVDEDTPKGTRSALLGATMNLVRFQTGDTSLKAPDLPKARKRVRYGRDALSETDVEAYEGLLTECGVPAAPRAVLRLLPWTGLRVGELCAVRRRDVTLQRTPKSLPGIEVVGKGNKTRWVPILARAREILTEYFAEIAEEGLSTDTWLFPSSKSPDMHTSPSTVRRHLRSIRGQLPVSARAVTPHVLRHTCATRLLAAGVDPVTIQTILGHADLETTRIYLHVSKQMIAEAFRKLEI